jgi:hypothetical protein
MADSLGHGHDVVSVAEQPGDAAVAHMALTRTSLAKRGVRG